MQILKSYYLAASQICDVNRSQSAISRPQNIKAILQSKYFLFAIAFLISVLVAIQSVSLGVKEFWGGHYTNYNNYVIFKHSFFHLIQNKNLYDLYLHDYADYFKYSPTFAFFMGAFAWLPDIVGLALWNLLNCAVLVYALTQIKGVSSSRLLYLVLFIAFELVLTCQHAQSNALICGLMILSFNSLEKEKPSRAAVFLVLGAFIKLFSLAGCLLFLFHPHKVRFIIYAIISTILIALIPLLVVSPTELINQYGNWLVLLTKDHAKSWGMSVYQIISYASGFINKNAILVVGLILLLIPLIKIRQFENYDFRLGYLSLLLTWVVVFNHRAESPTYIIAMTGVGLWAFKEKLNRIGITLVSLVWIFSSAIKTDLVPTTIKSSLNIDVLIPLFPTFLVLVIVAILVWPETKRYFILPPKISA